MANRTPASAFFNPFALWTDLAVKTSEMMVSSGQVIGHRTGRMARAGANPSTRDRREFSLMGREKLKAASSSGLAVASQLQSANLQVGLRAWQQGFAAWNAMASLGASRTFSQAVSRQHTLAQALARSGRTQAQLSGDAARLGHAALKPFHGASTANARRLAKVKSPAR